MTLSPLADRLRRAAQSATQASSDFDLNADGPPKAELRAAAVLVAVAGPEAAPRVVLTKRASTLRHHPGQIAFPGGKVDADDESPEAAALREAREEIGLTADAVEVIGRLPAHQTVTGFSVIPILARVPRPFHAIPEAGEVEEVFEVPLAHVAQSSNFLIRGRHWRGQMRRYYAVPFGPYYIWGATARILRGLAEVME